MLLLAEQGYWGGDPERIERRASALWFDRAMALNEARASATPTTHGGTVQQGKVQKQRLI